MPEKPPGLLEHPLIGVKDWLEASTLVLATGFLTHTPPDNFLRLLDKTQLEFLAWHIVATRAVLLRQMKDTDQIEQAHWMEAEPGPWITSVLPAIHRQIERLARLDEADGQTTGDLTERKAALRLEDVAGQHIHLTRSGANTFKGRCPFHAGGTERTASFVVFVASQRWKCFGACAIGGDVLDFLKKWREDHEAKA